MKQAARDTKTKESVWWTKLAQAREQMDMRKFYKIVQRLRTGAQQVFPGMIEGKDGTTKTTSRDIMREVVSFYSDI